MRWKKTGHPDRRLKLPAGRPQTRLRRSWAGCGRRRHLPTPGLGASVRRHAGLWGVVSMAAAPATVNRTRIQAPRQAGAIGKPALRRLRALRDHSVAGIRHLVGQSVRITRHLSPRASRQGNRLTRNGPNLGAHRTSSGAGEPVNRARARSRRKASYPSVGRAAEPGLAAVEPHRGQRTAPGRGQAGHGRAKTRRARQRQAKPRQANAARASRLSSRPSGSYAREPKRPASRVAPR